jgi:hypothetical protein
MDEFKGEYEIDMLRVRNISRSTWLDLTYGGRDTLLRCDVVKRNETENTCTVRVVANEHDAMLDDVNDAAVRVRKPSASETLPAPPEEPASGLETVAESPSTSRLLEDV